jgi:hypothetical protein
MMSFREFLERKAGEPQQKERRERRHQWTVAVGRLMDQLRAWLAQSDPGGLLDIVPLELEQAEPGLGVYKVPGLKIGVGDAAVQVVPVGRNVVGRVGSGREAGVRAEGRVDITDGVRKYILYRLVENGHDHWYALNEKFEAAPLNREQLEAILQDLLS